jgi:hypothetical protein
MARETRLSVEQLSRQPEVVWGCTEHRTPPGRPVTGAPGRESYSPAPTSTPPTGVPDDDLHPTAEEDVRKIASLFRLQHPD